MHMTMQNPVPQSARVREYETIYILRPDIDADGAEKVQTRVGEVLDRAKGKLVKVEAWGRRKLAYPIGKQRRGVYVYVKYLASGNTVTELERNLKLQDAVLKWQTVQLRDGVDVASVEIDPEETKLGRLELPAEMEPEESVERSLGLVDAPMEAGPRSQREPQEAMEAPAGEEEAAVATAGSEDE
jgi:small subunit ribosomal protein S6